MAKKTVESNVVSVNVLRSRKYGVDKFETVNIDKSLTGRMIQRSELENILGEFVVDIGSTRANLVWVDEQYGILGHQTAVQYVGSGLDYKSVKADVQRWYAITTVSGQLASATCNYTVLAVQRNFDKWCFGVADLEKYAKSVGKWNSVELKLKSLGFIK